jgi:signal transduction histidine kinase
MAGETVIALNHASGARSELSPREGNDAIVRSAVIMSRVAAGGAIVVGVLVLIGWAAWVTPFMSVMPGLVPMNPLTAICFLLAGGALWVQGKTGAPPWIRRVGRAFAVAVTVAGALRLFGYALGWQAGVDQLLFAEKLKRVAFAPNRMAPNTALNFVLLGTGLLVSSARHWAARLSGTACTLLTVLSAVLAMVGYANGVNSLYGVGSFIPMALHTAGTFLVLALGLLLWHAVSPSGAGAGADAGRDDAGDRPEPLPLERKIKFGFGAALFMALAVGVSAFLTIAQFSRDTLWCEHTRDVLMRIADLQSNLSNAEKDARGFVISGEESYLLPYRDAAGFVRTSLGTLRTRTADNPTQQRFLDRLAPLVERRLGNLQSTVDVRREHGFDADRHTVLAREGKLLMDDVQRVLQDMRGQEEALLGARLAALASSTRRTFAVIVGGCCLAFVLVAFAGVVIRRDMIARARAERHARELNLHLDRHAVQLEAANKELEAFSYSVSHDLRAPLRSIDGFSKAILEDYGDRLDADGHDHLRRVCAAADRMGRLIDDMLNLSRVTRAELRHERLDLTELARAVIAELRSAQPDRNPAVVIADGMEADGDPRLLRILLDNLIGNAWKFTSKKPDARIEVGTLSRDGRPAFYVRDDGAGFDMAFAHKLFGAFQRLHAMEEFGGTGVGLATVQRIAHRHGGRVWAEGEVGRGATFYFTLGTGTL